MRELNSAVHLINFIGLAALSEPKKLQWVPEVGSWIKPATVSDIKNINKTRFVKTTEGWFHIPHFHLDPLKTCSYDDATLNNLHNLYDQDGFSVAISWSSNKIQKAVRYTLAAETIACAEHTDVASCTK